MNITDLTWDFKFKRYPDGIIKKFKAWFFSRGDWQWEGIDLFETYVPVVHGETIGLMLIIEVLLGLISNIGKITAAFIHVDILDNKKVYVKIPRGNSTVIQERK